MKPSPEELQSCGALTYIEGKPVVSVLVSMNPETAQTIQGSIEEQRQAVTAFFTARQAPLSEAGIKIQLDTSMCLGRCVGGFLEYDSWDRAVAACVVQGCSLQLDGTVMVN